MDKKLDNLRHSASHLLAAAILNLYPNVKPTLGPPIENGFYYDFDMGEIKISEEEFPKIEEKMREIVKNWKIFERIEVEEDKAGDLYNDNVYKKELIEEFSKKGEKISLYKSGNFTDLCRGGHVEFPDKELKYFKILSVAGAYWRGDEKNKRTGLSRNKIFP